MDTVRRAKPPNAARSGSVQRACRALRASSHLADIAMLIPGHPRSQSRVRPSRPHSGFLHSAPTIRTTRPDTHLRTPSSDGGAPPHRSYRPRQVVSAGADRHITAHPSYVKFLQSCTTAHLDLMRTSKEEEIAYTPSGCPSGLHLRAEPPLGKPPSRGKRSGGSGNRRFFLSGRWRAASRL